MFIKVLTKRPQRLISDTVSLLRQRGADYDEWKNLHHMQFGNRDAIEIVPGSSVTFKVLTSSQLQAVEDVVIHQHLPYTR